MAIRNRKQRETACKNALVWFGSATLVHGTVLRDVLKQDGPLGLFNRALPRAMWTGPQGAMYFAGYELAKKALAGPQSMAQGKAATAAQH